MLASHSYFTQNALGNYGKSLKFGCVHIFRSLPRMLTLWFNYAQIFEDKLQVLHHGS